MRHFVPLDLGEKSTTILGGKVEMITRDVTAQLNGKTVMNDRRETMIVREIVVRRNDLDAKCVTRVY